MIVTIHNRKYNDEIAFEIDELNNDRKKNNEVREKQDKNAAALRDLLGESTPDLDFIMESIFMDIDH